MKLDFKSILILVLLGCTLIFGYMWFFRGDDGSKEQLKQLQEEYKEIEKQKKESDKRLIEYNEQLDSLLNVDKINKEKLLELEANVLEAENRANESESKFKDLQAQLKETRDKIKEFKNNPPNRTGDDLLNSIKNKTK